MGLFSHITLFIGHQQWGLVVGCPVWDDAMNRPVPAAAGSSWLWTAHQSLSQSEERMDLSSVPLKTGVPRGTGAWLGWEDTCVRRCKWRHVRGHTERHRKGHTWRKPWIDLLGEKGRRSGGAVWKGTLLGSWLEIHPPHWGRDTPEGMGARGGSHTRAEEQ